MFLKHLTDISKIKISPNFKLNQLFIKVTLT